MDKTKLLFNITILNHVLENQFLFIPENCLSGHIFLKISQCENFQSRFEPCVLEFHPFPPPAGLRVLRGDRAGRWEREKVSMPLISLLHLGFTPLPATSHCLSDQLCWPPASVWPALTCQTPHSVGDSSLKALQDLLTAQISAPRVPTPPQPFLPPTP